jgi:hypothetical protein
MGKITKNDGRNKHIIMYYDLAKNTRLSMANFGWGKGEEVPRNKN